MNNLKKLELWSEYSREEVHSIFSPNTKFTPQAGTWGLQGMIRIPSRENDWVFFVTYGQEQGEHVFDESITEDGVLSWQSQPSLGFASKAIKSLVEYDDRIDNIYLFLRGSSRNKYCYLGRLGYLTHDIERERPVYFQWQLMDWPAPKGLLTRIGITPISQFSENILESVETIQKNQLTLTNKPDINNTKVGTKTSEFRSRKSPDYGLKDSQNRQLGMAGELLVLQVEIDYLKSNNRGDLADKVVHVSVVEGDGAGYDILSFELDGSIKYIEVKTTKGIINSSFFLSSNEIEFSKRYSENYYLYRIYDYDIKLNSGKMYHLKGNLLDILKLKPTQFKASLI